MNELPSSPTWFDSNNVRIRPGDLVLYGYGDRVPIVGKVLALTRSGIKIAYVYEGYWGTEDTRAIDTICKRPLYTVVMNRLVHNEEIRRLFKLQIIENNYSFPAWNNEMLEPTEDTEERPGY